MRGYLGLPVMILGVLAPCCGKKPLSDEEKIRALLPEAAAIRKQDLRRPGASGYESLTSVFFGAISGLSGRPDFVFESSSKSIHEALSRRPMSVIIDEDITSFACDVKADEATGTVAFEHEGFWRGSVGFRAERREGEWRIVEFRLIPTKRMMSLGADGLWVLLDPVEPLNPVLVGVEDNGEFSIGDPHFARRIKRFTREELYAFLKQAAADSPRGIDQSPAVRVVIDAAGGTPYEHVQNAMVQCIRAYISGISWRLTGRVLAADLPKGPVSMDESRAFDSGATIVPLDASTRPGLGGDEVVDAPVGLGEDEMPIPRGSLFTPTRRMSREIRVKLCWENGKNEPIHSPLSVYPKGWVGKREAKRSLAGTHVAIHLGEKRLRPTDELAAALVKIVERRPDTAVTIDASPTVSFRHVFGALDACRKANVKSVNFQAPPAPDSGGGDSLWQ